MNTDYVRKNKSKWIPKILVILFAGLIILFPNDAFLGGKNGLLLWFNSVLPSLLPFMIISNLIVNMDIARLIGKFLYPVFKFIFRVSPNGCYPILIGLLSGIPLGAKTVSDLVARNDISLEEGQYILSFSNNASPMFVMSFIAISQLNQPSLRFYLLFINFISGYLGGILYFKIGKRAKNTINKSYIHAMEVPVTITEKESPVKFDFSILDKSIMDSFEVITKVGGYIILFSIPGQIISSSPHINPWIKIISIGILEITTAINYITTTSISLHTKIVLIVAITAFGGLSALAQTNSVINNTRLSIVTYIKNKIIQMFTAVILIIIVINLFL